MARVIEQPKARQRPVDPEELAPALAPIVRQAPPVRPWEIAFYVATVAVAFLLRMSEHPLDIEGAAMVTKAARQIEELGCKVEEVDAPPYSHADAGKSFVTHWLTNSARLLDLYPEARWGEFDPNLLAGAKAARRR